MKPTILVVDDNMMTRELVSKILQREGFAVLEAADGHSALQLVQSETPDLILQDLILPDMTGFELNQQLRNILKGKDIPILAISGFLNRMDEEKAIHAGFDSFLMKPISAASLTKIVNTYLSSSAPATNKEDFGKRVLIADDDAAQRKILSHFLRSSGFIVEVAVDGQEALKMAINNPPDAIISDILMPHLDGFDLCMKIREHPKLAQVPVILATANYLEKSDHLLAERAGANAYVTRTSDCDTIIEALKENLGGSVPQNLSTSEKAFKDEHQARVSRQLERQIIANFDLAQQCAVQQAELSLLNSITGSLTNRKKMENILQDVLLACLDAMGISKGVLYLINRQSGEIYLKHYVGYNKEQQKDLADFFGEIDLLIELMDKKRISTIPSKDMTKEMADDLLIRAAVSSSLIVPLISADKCIGVLFLGYRSQEFIEGDLEFARTLGSHFSQVVAMTETLNLLMQAEKRYKAILENVNSAIILHDEKGIILEANKQCEKLFGYPEDEMIGRDFKDFFKNDANTFSQNLKMILKEKKPYTATYSIKTANDVQKVTISIVPIEIDNENLFLVVL